MDPSTPSCQTDSSTQAYECQGSNVESLSCDVGSTPSMTLQKEKSVRTDKETVSLAEVQHMQSVTHGEEYSMDERCDPFRTPDISPASSTSDTREKEQMNMILRPTDNWKPASSKNSGHGACNDLETCEVEMLIALTDEKKQRVDVGENISSSISSMDLTADMVRDASHWRQDRTGTQHGSEEGKLEDEDVKRPVQDSQVQDEVYTQSSLLAPSGCEYGDKRLSQPARTSTVYNLQANAMHKPNRLPDVCVHKSSMTSERETQTSFSTKTGKETCEMAVQVPEAESVHGCLSAALALRGQCSVDPEAGAVESQHIAAATSPGIDVRHQGRSDTDNAKLGEEHWPSNEKLDFEAFAFCEIMGDPDECRIEITSEMKDAIKIRDHEPEDAERIHFGEELLKPCVLADDASPTLTDEERATERESHEDQPRDTAHDEPLFDLQTTKPKEYTSKDCLEHKVSTDEHPLDPKEVCKTVQLDDDRPPDKESLDCDPTSHDLPESKRSHSELRFDLEGRTCRDEAIAPVNSTQEAARSCGDENGDDSKVTAVNAGENKGFDAGENKGFDAGPVCLQMHQGRKKCLADVSEEEDDLDKTDAWVESKKRVNADLQECKEKLMEEDKLDPRCTPGPKLLPLFDLRRHVQQQLVVFPLFGPSLSRDMVEEGARLRTFLQYLRTSHFSALRLANAGFFYMGQGDTLQCYSCGVTFDYSEENQGEDPYILHSRLSPSCPHIRGLDLRNVFVQDEQLQARSALDITGQRAAERQRVPEIVHATKVSLELMRSQLAALGIFLEPLLSSRGQHQSVTSESQVRSPPEPGGAEVEGSVAALAVISSAPTVPNSGVLESADQQTEHNASSENSNASEVVTAQAPPPPEAPALDVSEEDLRFLSEIPLGPGDLREPVASAAYDPSAAIHSKYSDRAERLASFNGRWPDTHGQSPQALALAGFFYTGKDDCVRCHFCALGLKDWEPDDMPLDEHVLWRHSCGYLCALLGDALRTRIVIALARKRHGEGTANLTGTGGGLASPRGAMGGTVAGTVAFAAPTLPATVPEQPASVERWMTSDAVRPAREMGFTDVVIRRAVQALLLTRAGVRAINRHNVVHAIMYIRERDQRDDRDEEPYEDLEMGSDDENSSSLEPTPPSTPPMALSPGSSAPAAEAATRGHEGDEASRSPVLFAGNSGSDQVSMTAEELEQENQELRERRRCKICLDNDVSILFLPCGHLVCCAECAPALRRCPMCRVRINGTVRIQMAPIAPPDSSSNRDGNDREGNDREANVREGNDRDGNDRDGNDRDGNDREGNNRRNNGRRNQSRRHNHRRNNRDNNQD